MGHGFKMATSKYKDYGGLSVSLQNEERDFESKQSMSLPRPLLIGPGAWSEKQTRLTDLLRGNFI